MLRQALSPGIHRVLRDAEGDVTRASPVVLWQRAWRQDITARYFVSRVHCLAADDQQIALIGETRSPCRSPSLS